MLQSYFIIPGGLYKISAKLQPFQIICKPASHSQLTYSSFGSLRLLGSGISGLLYLTFISLFYILIYFYFIHLFTLVLFVCFYYFYGWCTDPIHLNVKCKCEKQQDKLRLSCSHITSITGIVIKLIRRNWFGSLNYNV